MSLRLTSATAVLTMTVGAVLAAAPAAAAGPPVGQPLPVTVSRSSLIAQGYTCTASRCTRSTVVWNCNGAMCTLRV